MIQRHSQSQTLLPDNFRPTIRNTESRKNINLKANHLRPTNEEVIHTKEETLLQQPRTTNPFQNRTQDVEIQRVKAGFLLLANFRQIST
jgi:hypothetical protein